MSQVERAKNMSREEALEDKQHERIQKIPFVVTYHPSLPNIGGIPRELHPILESSDTM